MALCFDIGRQDSSSQVPELAFAARVRLILDLLNACCDQLGTFGVDVRLATTGPVLVERVGSLAQIADDEAALLKVP